MKLQNGFKYYVPVIGWVIAIREYEKANKAFWDAKALGKEAWEEYDATWPAFDNTFKGLAPTVLFLWLLGIALVAIFGGS